MNLPALPKSKDNNESAIVKKDKSDGEGFSLPEIEASHSLNPPEEDDYSEYVWADERRVDNEKDPYESLINQGVIDSYEDLKESYGNIISIIEGVSYEVYTPEEESNLNTNNFQTIKELEDAIQDGSVNLTEYDMKDIDLLLSELEILEQEASSRDINEYGLKTVDDFYNAVESGEIDLSKYDMKEIDTLIKTLEDDKTMMLSEFDMSVYGNKVEEDNFVSSDNNSEESSDSSEEVSDEWEGYWEDIEYENTSFISMLFKKIANFFEIE